MAEIPINYFRKEKMPLPTTSLHHFRINSSIVSMMGKQTITLYHHQICRPSCLTKAAVAVWELLRMSIHTASILRTLAEEMLTLKCK